MSIQDELLKLQRDLSAALKEESYAEAELETANQNYAQELAKWEAEHSELVRAKQIALLRKTAAGLALGNLMRLAEVLLSNAPLSDLPLGFAQEESTRVRYEPQGFTKIARDSFPYLLCLNEEAVQDFFKNMAVKQSDGAFILPENIRIWAAVEVVGEIVPIIDTEVLKQLAFPPEVKQESEWTPPANATAFLTAPNLVDTRELLDMPDTDKLPELEEDSSEGEFIPMGKAFHEDRTWNNQAAWDTEKGTKTTPYPIVPPTHEIEF